MIILDMEEKIEGEGIERIVYMRGTGWRGGGCLCRSSFSDWLCCKPMINLEQLCIVHACVCMCAVIVSISID